MIDQKTDLTFFTNDQDHTLLDRFKATLKDTRLFDVLVGYFRSSGFYLLCDSIEPTDKARILVGLGIDNESMDAIAASQSQANLDFTSHASAKNTLQGNLVREIENSEESDRHLELGLKKFIQFLQADCPDPAEDNKRGGNGKKLEIRAFPSRNIHAKVYIGRFAPSDRDYGFVITGSSNFSYSGLVANREFNVELRQRRDVEHALEQFEELWRESADISKGFVDAVQKKTWLNDTITPHELYLKLIYEYMQEDINLQEHTEIFLPEGFMRLQYQQQAVQQAIKKLNEHNGVFLADVVGLGKTFITAQLLQQLKGKALVICPPTLKEYWEKSLLDFLVAARVESLGKLDKAIGLDRDQFDYIVVDEAHRFRNDTTQSYANLLDICRGKKVILVTATPLNNTIDDIFAQLKLFQAPKNSSIPGIPNLEYFFAELRKRFKGMERNDPIYKQTIEEVSREIREKILKYVMVRRTRSDVTTWFKKDIEEQGLLFPEVQDPKRVVYSLEGELEAAFAKTIELLQGFKYARYVPLLYYTGTQLSEFEQQQQRNVGGFMKSVLIKRLESSFHAFRSSVDRFIASCERFIAMFEQGTVYISNTVDVYELLDDKNWDELEKLVEDEEAQKYASENFQKQFLKDLRHDIDTLRQIQELWRDVDADPKLEALISQLQDNDHLKDNKLIIFTESKETGGYLFDHLNHHYPKQVMFFSSQGGRTGDSSATLNSVSSRDRIKAAFDPNQRENNGSELRILISTDVLAEGINLHRANALINYDLPWNPTRVLQRAGRINRLGTEHPEVHIYNFFPTSQADEHLGLEANIVNKIQMFHDIMGEDAKYISDGEEIGSQELFETLNRKGAYTGEDGEGDPELKYLEMMRKLRDEQPHLFKRIKQLPKKARSGLESDQVDANQLVTFFRLGQLKKFYLNRAGESSEITFFDAVNLMACEPDTPRHKIPENYHDWLEANRHRFEEDSLQSGQPATAPVGGHSNIRYIEKRLKDKAFRNFPGFTDADDELIKAVRHMIAQGLLAKSRVQLIKKALDNTLDPLEIVAILREHIPVVVSGSQSPTPQSRAKREVILSAYQVPVGAGKAHNQKTGESSNE